MTASSYTTNPRRIIHIPPSQIDLSFKRNLKSNVIETFSFGGVDLSGLHGGGSIPNNAEIFLEVRNRQDSQRQPLESPNNYYNLIVFIFASIVFITRQN